MKNIKLVKNVVVTSMAEAYEIYNDHTSRGLEGVVIKTPDGMWRDSSSGTKDAVKLKVKFEAEFEVVDSYEGEGKAVGMLGGVTIKTSEGKITNNVGSGFSDKQRKDFWAVRETLPGKIMTVESNGVISNRDKETLSLSLGVFVEFREDKTVADSYEDVMAALTTAMHGGKK